MKDQIKRCVRYLLLWFLFNCMEFIVLGYGHPYIALLLLLLLFWTPYRYLWGNLDRLLRSLVVNAFNYFRYKEYNCPSDIGTITAYVAHTNKVFGCAKTLSAVYYAYRLYKRYDGVRYYDYKCQNPKWVTWKVEIISNLDIKGVPVTPFTSMQQLVDLSSQDRTGIYTIVLIDECNAVFNSRDFKNNFQNEEQIRSIVTCRHSNMQLLLVGQRYKYLDALIRNMTDQVYECVHIPIINTVIHYVYSAYDLETVDNPALIRKLCWRWSYIYDWVYKLYDTKALVSLVAKTPSVSSQELLERKQTNNNPYGNRNLSRTGKKFIKG